MVLGFFSPGNSKNRYLGIWYKKVPVQTVVWVANRCNPIHDLSGLLTINSTGNVELLYRNKSSVVWSTRSFKEPKKPILVLLDTGNLVLNDNSTSSTTTPESYLWQSFDYPSDTLLPGMKLGWNFQAGLKRSLSAWKNLNDPCPGNFSYGFEFEHQASPEVYMMKGTAKYYRSGPWNGLRFSGVPELIANPVYDFQYVYDDRELYYMYNLMIEREVLTRIVLNETSSLRQRYVWLEGNHTWRRFSSAPMTDCDKYGFCGANGSCVMRKNVPTCHCLKGFKPSNQEKWDSSDWSGGCVRKTPLSCQDKDKDEFIIVGGLKLPETTHSLVNRSLNLMECRAKCLRNCSCVAYSNLDIRGQGSGCIMWFGDLLDIREFPSNGQNLYLRISASELAVIGSVSVMLLFVCYCMYRRRCSKAARERKQYNTEGKDDLELPLFDLATIATATENFADDNKLGQGGFGPVYKGILKDGQEIAVKRLSRSSGQGLNEFKNEVILIAKLQHRNLVRLLGCCIQGEEKLLLYEYMPNRSLNFFIFDETRKKLLDWPKRFKIICGIARGLLYLHQDSRLRIIHRDLKAGNVLLDNEMNPKISDFGMAKLFGGNQTEGNTTRVVGTYGYMAPEYASDGLFSVKSDVFSFGILVLEIISGKKNRGFFHRDDSLNLTGHVWRLWNEGNSLELIDECLAESCYEPEVLRCIHIGLLCIQQCPEDRPCMASVVVMFGSQSSLDPPKQPGFFIQKEPLEFDAVNSSSYKQESSSKNEVTITLLEAR
ncbi:G-type lectin S-receptor-like serine/threonine-protein kinase [Morus notabilis]|uniref:Receptor-like serine/threonine-protein kinase n=1 Tax=Morus notabilis TaxID=981085 RepID=W9RS41_9ROSA|nr:G-type lectin S-receptor-like serine/threonine-protein kinase [Morus notabilis]